MLLNNDVMADRQAKAGPFSGRLGRKKRVEHLLFHLGWNTGAVVADPDFNLIAKALGRGSEGWYVIASIRFGLALDRCIEAIRDQVQKCPSNVLREQVNLARRRIKGPLQGDVEALFLGPRPVPGEVEAFLNNGIDIDDAVFTRAFARVQQHVLDDGIRALAMLHDLVEVAS